MEVMRCGDCDEFFEVDQKGRVREIGPNGTPHDLLLCPVCRLKATQRGISELPQPPEAPSE